MRLIKFSTDKANKELGQPQPMKNLLPEWYRRAESTYTSKHGSESPGLKKCAPYLDALISGYAVVTPFDIYVSSIDGKVEIKWDGPQEFDGFIAERESASGRTMPRPAGHADNHLVWSSPWGFKVPRGWSVLVTHPLNRFDLPFTTSSGIIDSDAFWASGNVPFFIKEGFTGIIPAGTPYMQLLPIKRANWLSVHDQGISDKIAVQGMEVRKEGQSYKQTKWKRKKYN